MLSIKRERYVIIRDDSEIYCGSYLFSKIDNLDNNLQIKTYTTKEKAKQAFQQVGGMEKN